MTKYKGDDILKEDILKISTQIYITLPGRWSYKSHNTTNISTTYNSQTGIWDIGFLKVGESVTLIINVRRSSGNTDGVAEIISSSLLDPNPSNNKAFITLH